MNFPNAVTRCLSKFSNFSGRATRSEFWWFYLFTLILIWVTNIAVGGGVAEIVNLVMMVPLWAAGERRLHDIGRTGWWQLIVFTGIGLVLLIYWYSRDSVKETNQYGEYVEKPMFEQSAKTERKNMSAPTIIIDNPEVQIVSIKKSGGSDWTLAVCTRSNSNISEMTIVGDGGGNGFVHDETFNYRAHPNN